MPDILYINGLYSQSVLKIVTYLFIHLKDYGDLKKMAIKGEKIETTCMQHIYNSKNSSLNLENWIIFTNLG